MRCWQESTRSWCRLRAGSTAQTSRFPRGASRFSSSVTSTACSFAKLSIAATNLKQEPLLPTVTLDEWTVPGHASTATVVPACKARMKVSAPEVGAFIEDVELKEGAEVRRAVVLAPGSDVVRIHGGTLTFRDGRTFPDVRGVAGERDEDPFGDYEHTLATYDIDQREVTTAEFHACHLAGACVSTFDKRRKSPYPLDREAHLCTSDVIKDLRPPVPGKEDIAMNCVVRWEAEEYCRWVGKRLPDVEEWSSRREAEATTNGGSRTTNAANLANRWNSVLARRRKRGSRSLHGRLAQDEPRTVRHVWERCRLVVTTPRSQWTAAAGQNYHGSGLPWGHDDVRWGDDVRRYGERQRPAIGFRCARTVEGSRRPPSAEREPDDDFLLATLWWRLPVSRRSSTRDQSACCTASTSTSTVRTGGPASGSAAKTSRRTPARGSSVVRTRGTTTENASRGRFSTRENCGRTGPRTITRASTSRPSTVKRPGTSATGRTSSPTQTAIAKPRALIQSVAAGTVVVDGSEPTKSYGIRIVIEADEVPKAIAAEIRRVRPSKSNEKLKLFYIYAHCHASKVKEGQARRRTRCDRRGRPHGLHW